MEKIKNIITVNVLTKSSFAENQPVTSIVNSVKTLLEEQPVGNDIWIALVWCAGILIVSQCLAVRIYRKCVQERAKMIYSDTMLW